MTDRYDRGKERAELKMILEREQHWRKKYASLTKQMREIKAVVKLHNNELKSNNFAKPHLVQRTVGLQAVICTKKVNLLCDKIIFINMIKSYILNK